MADHLIYLLGPHPAALLVAVIADLAFGDPVYRLHPVRLIGDALRFVEHALRSIGLDGYGGGIALFAILASLSVAVVVVVVFASSALSPWLAWAVHVFILYSLLALGDLLRHARRVERAIAGGDLAAAQFAVSMFVARDTDRMDTAECRRSSIESLSENLTDGFISALFWYALLGLPGLVLFKVVSTMDSMVGNKTPQYIRFGWCGARLDDVMNYLPARLTWILIAMVALVLPRCSARKALAIGIAQHGYFPSPNSGWSEAAIAGAIQRRLVGPIWKQGMMVTDLWIGDPSDPPAGSSADFMRALAVTLAAGLAAVALAEGVLLTIR